MHMYTNTQTSTNKYIEKNTVKEKHNKTKRAYTYAYIWACHGVIGSSPT